jgi:hypothetical protein
MRARGALELLRGSREPRFGGTCGDPEQAGQPKCKGPHKPDEKSLPGVARCPYRKPTQVGRGHSPQADERPLVKELGKLSP